MKLRVGNMTPAQQQKVLANFRRGQAAFNNYNREVKLVNALGDLALKRTKVARGLAVFHRHTPGSYHNRQNNQINAAIQRNLNALNANKTRLERELIDLRRRLMNNFRPGSGATLSNRNMLSGYNSTSFSAGINRLRKKRIGRYGRKAVPKPGGPYSLKSMKQTLNEINQFKKP